MGCGEIKETAACCSFRKRLEALTYIDQMLGRQLESWQVATKGNPGSPGGAVESCFLLVQAQMRPAAAASLPCTRGPLPCFPQPHFLSPFPLLSPPCFFSLPPRLFQTPHPHPWLCCPRWASWPGWHTARGRIAVWLLAGSLSLETQPGWGLRGEPTYILETTFAVFET